MSSVPEATGSSESGLAARIAEIRLAIGQIPATLLTERTGASYRSLGPGRGEFRLSFLDAPVLVTYPGMVGIGAEDEMLPLPYQAVLAYYFHTSDGMDLAGQWISFAELPDGRIYNQAFQGYSGDELVKVYGYDLEAFELACQRKGGAPVSMGDAAFEFYALPRLPLLVIYWCGDEEFPSNCNILFDRSVSHYLPTDVCAILGGMLARKLARS